jgi:hypothetical protein
VRFQRSVDTLAVGLYRAVDAFKTACVFYLGEGIADDLARDLFGVVDCRVNISRKAAFATWAYFTLMSRL